MLTQKSSLLEGQKRLDEIKSYMSNNTMKNKPKQSKPPGFETLAIHAGASPDPTTGARNVPIYNSTAYVFDDVDHAASLFNLQTFGYLYSRIGNPTVSALEEKVAALENGRAAVATASGHAAQLLAMYILMEPGANFVSSPNLYGGSITQFTHTFKKFGWECRFADAKNLNSYKDLIDKNTKAIFIEVLANPGGIVVDIEPISEIAKSEGIPLIVDNTTASPYLCQPFDWGADIIIHSMTKFLGGHGNAMGGIVVESGKFDWAQNNKFPALTQPDPAYHNLTFYETFGDFGFSTKGRAVALRDLGPTLSPTNASLISTGIETLPLRMERHVENALIVANYLNNHERVEWVSYAGLKNSPYYELAKKYLPKGPGSLFTFGLVGGYESGIKLVESAELISHLANLGDTRSLIIHPASTTHRQLTDEQRLEAGAGPEVVRISVGLESADDIIADLEQSLESAGA